MDLDFFEKLISKSEGNTLDFKKQNYDFSGTTPSEKKDKAADFIKDIICFANTVKNSSAHIIIGIEELDNGEKVFHGIDKHIDDVEYQDKIKDKVHPIPKFSYHRVLFKEKNYGVIEIPIVKYKDTCKVRKPLKGLQPEGVYFRRSSRNSEAKEHEIVEIHNWLEQLDSNLLYTQEEEISYSSFLMAYIDSDIEKGRRIYEELKKGSKDEKEQIELEFEFLFHEYVHGTQDANEKLNTLTECQTDNEIKSEGYMYQGLCHKWFDNFPVPISYFEKAKLLTRDDVKVVDLVDYISICLFENGDKEESVSILLKTINEISTSEALFQLYKRIAKFYEKENNEILEISALQKALEVRPNDTDIIFNLAYSSAKAVKGLSYNYYSRLNTSVSLNNTGVILQNIELKGKSISMYKRAAEQGNTLAASNLAYLYMNQGFYNDARTTLKKAMERDDVHKNIYEALSELNRKEEEETQALSKFRTNGKIQTDFLRHFSGIFFNRNVEELNLQGTWKDSKNQNTVLIRKTDGFYQFICDSFDKEYQISSAFKYVASKISYREKGKTTYSSWGDYFDGYAYLNADHNVLEILIIKETELIQKTFNKISDDIISKNEDGSLG